MLSIVVYLFCFDAVKPNPVYLSMGNIYSTSAFVSWLPPADDKQLLCQVICTSIQGFELDQV